MTIEIIHNIVIFEGVGAFIKSLRPISARRKNKPAKAREKKQVEASPVQDKDQLKMFEETDGKEKD